MSAVFPSEERAWFKVEYIWTVAYTGGGMGNELGWAVKDLGYEAGVDSLVSGYNCWPK